MLDVWSRAIRKCCSGILGTVALINVYTNHNINELTRTAGDLGSGPAVLHGRSIEMHLPSLSMSEVSALQRVNRQAIQRRSLNSLLLKQDVFGVRQTVTNLVPALPKPS